MTAGEDQPQPVVLDDSGRRSAVRGPRSSGPPGAWRRDATRDGSCRSPGWPQSWSTSHPGWGVRRRAATARARPAVPPQPRPPRCRGRRSGGPATRRSGRTPRGRSARSPDPRRSRVGLLLEGTHLDPAAHAFEPSAAHVSAASRSGASMIQKPPRYSFDSTNGPSVITTSAPVLSTRWSRRALQPAGEDPGALGLELVVEDSGGGEHRLHLLGGHRIQRGDVLGGVVHGEQVLAHQTSSWWWDPVRVRQPHHERAGPQTTPARDISARTPPGP